MWCTQMHSTQRDHLHVGCWKHVGEAQPWCCWCSGERVSVRWLLPVGLLAFSRFCLKGHPVLLWLICRVGSIGSICIFSRRPSRQTLSKAFVKSKKSETTFLFSWKTFSTSWAMRASWSSVLLRFQYPVCVGVSIFCSSKNYINLLLIARSRSFPRQLRRLMGR